MFAFLFCDGDSSNVVAGHMASLDVKTGMEYQEVIRANSKLGHFDSDAPSSGFPFPGFASWKMNRTYSQPRECSGKATG